MDGIPNYSIEERKFTDEQNGEKDYVLSMKFYFKDIESLDNFRMEVVEIIDRYI